MHASALCPTEDACTALFTALPGLGALTWGHVSPEQDPRRAPCTEHNFKRFDTVMGRVVKQLFKGSLVELLDDPRIIGYCPLCIPLMHMP